MNRKNTSEYRQRGMGQLKTIGILVGLGVFMLIVLFIGSAPPPSTGQEQPAPATDQPAGTGEQAQEGQTDDKSKVKEAFIRIPDGYRPFTSKQYNFAVSYPSDWGSLQTLQNVSNSILRAETKLLAVPVGAQAQAIGNFSITVYPADSFVIAIRPGNPIVKPEEKDGKTVWRVESAALTDDKYRVGNTYPLTSTTVASGLTMYDFTWFQVDGNRQSRWAFKAGDTFIVMSMPPLSRMDESRPTDTDVQFYKALANGIMHTVNLPGPTATSD